MKFFHESLSFRVRRHCYNDKKIKRSCNEQYTNVRRRENLKESEEGREMSHAVCMKGKGERQPER